MTAGAAVPLSTAVWSADGELLRVTRSSDDQYRMWVPLSGISPDARRGVAAQRGSLVLLAPGRQSGCARSRAFRTYIARRAIRAVRRSRCSWRDSIYRLNTRTPAGKLRQIGAALWLEARYSKHELLEAYLNVVPFGGNIQGVGAASRIYFGKPPDRLTFGEALTLAVIPQRPSQSRRTDRRPNREPPDRPRTNSGDAWLARPPRSPVPIAASSTLPIVARARFSMPRRRRRISSTRCSPVAVMVPGAHRHHDRRRSSAAASNARFSAISQQHGDRGIRNASALLVDTRDMAVKAWVGSADYWNETDRRTGERRAGQTIAGLDAQALRLRARARSGRAASADDGARSADVVRTVRAGEFRRPLLRPHHAPKRR